MEQQPNVYAYNNYKIGSTFNDVTFSPMDCDENEPPRGLPSQHPYPSTPRQMAHQKTFDNTATGLMDCLRAQQAGKSAGAVTVPAISQNAISYNSPPSTSKEARRQLANKLNADHFKTLAETISVEKIAAIKAKRLANKNNAARESIMAEQQCPKPPPQSMVLKYFENESQEASAVTKLAMERESLHCTRAQLLLGDNELTTARQALMRIFDMKTRRLIDRPIPSEPIGPSRWSSMYRTYRPPMSCEEVDTPLSVAPKLVEAADVEVMSPLDEPTKGKRSRRDAHRAGSSQLNVLQYNRYDQERFLKPVAVSQQFGINPLGTNMIKQPSISRKKAGSNQKPSKSSYQNVYSKGMTTSNKLIIVVPNAMSSLITLHNAKQLLQEMRYVPSEEMRLLHPGRISEVIIERQWKGELQHYRVIDSVTHLTPEDWKRVAAVFVLGPNWQFKGWPWHSDPVFIFHHVCAFHLCFTEASAYHGLDKLWVTILSLSQYDRHLDCSVLMDFWNTLDEYVSQRDEQFAFLKPSRSLSGPSQYNSNASKKNKSIFCPPGTKPCI